MRYNEQVIDLPGRAPSQDSAPPPLRSLAEAGVPPNELMKLVIKALQVTALETPSKICELVALPSRAVRELLEEAQERQLVHVLGSTEMSMTAEFRYALTEKGKDAANDYLRQNGYVGPAPVSLAAFCQQVRRQKITDQSVERARIDRAFRGLIVSEKILRQLGPAINAARAILLYGPPGNGKTTLGQRIADLYEDVIYVPYCFEIDGQIVKVFDPQVHIAADRPAQEETRDLRRDLQDARWVACHRQVVTTGGELTLEMLDLSFEAESRFYEAPLHIKALGGVFILDDFGRQLVSPEALLNRWTAPLENRVDFLKLHTGKSFAIPFDATVVFSTNLEPDQLMDPAFLRRIPYKIGVFAPTEAEYREVFRFVCDREDVRISEADLDAVMARLAERPWIALANYQPGFILGQVQAACKYEGVPLQFRPDLVDLALDNLGAGLIGREGPPASHASVR
jgi:predicted ATPase with chaperone activity